MDVPSLCTDWHLKFNAELRQAFNTEDNADISIKIIGLKIKKVILTL